jgi:hypothetical protein
MKILKQLESELNKIGASLDVYDGFVCCDAPSGYVWNATDSPSLIILYSVRSNTWLTAAMRDDGYPRLSKGLKKVTDSKQLANIRHDLDDDQWGNIPATAPEFIKFNK